MLPRIAWRNIWRNPRRSWVLISAVATGAFSFLGLLAYIGGFSIQFVNNGIRLQGGHIQVAGAGYVENPNVHTRMADTAPVTDLLSQWPEANHLVRLEAPGLASSAEQAAGVVLFGVNPGAERDRGAIAASLVEGEYLSENAGGLIMGQSLARSLNVLVGERVVLMANDLTNDLAYSAHRVTGLFKTNSELLDETHVYLHQSDLASMVGFAPGEASTISVHLSGGIDADEVAGVLREQLAGADLDILSWRERIPAMATMEEMLRIMNVILAVVLFSAICFTLVNSFLMVVYERLREIGIMMANGVQPRIVRRILYMEALFMVGLGLAIGTTLASGLIAWWARVGLDLSAFEEGLRSFGYGATIFPHLDLEQAVVGYAVVLLMAALAVAWPAWKASRFKIIAALHHV